MTISVGSRKVRHSPEGSNNHLILKLAIAFITSKGCKLPDVRGHVLLRFIIPHHVLYTVQGFSIYLLA